MIERMTMQQNRQIKRLLSLMVLTAAVVSSLFSASYSECRMVKKYLGKFYISSYDMTDNTPSNSYATASGKRATVGRTVAVDAHNPIVPMGSKVIIQGVGERIVEDTGGFGRYNNGMRKFDVFTEVGKGFLKQCKTWLVRPETKAERKKRLLKEKRRRERIRRQRLREKRKREKKLRKERQKGEFIFRYSNEVQDLQAITDPTYIKGGTFRVGTKYFDVVGTRKGLENVILVGDPELRDLNMEIKCKLDEVCEEAVG